MRPNTVPSIRTALAAAALALLASPASAQLAPQAKGPVDITADELLAANAECTSTWRGNVEALQDTSRLRSNTLTAFMAKKGSDPGQPGGACGDLVRMEAHGSVYYVTPQQRLHGHDAIYEAASETLTITGDVVAVQGQNVLRGSKLVVNTQTGQAQMQSVNKGRNKPGRVRGVFYPQQTQAPAAQRR